MEVSNSRPFATKSGTIIITLRRLPGSVSFKNYLYSVLQITLAYLMWKITSSRSDDSSFGKTSLAVIFDEWDWEIEINVDAIKVG